jgi:FkbM family methyltransferase
METYNTKYGDISLLKNERFIGWDFKHGQYWDENTLLALKKYIDPNRNILEIGGHCGTSTIVYSSFLKNDKKVFVYEPQHMMYNLLCRNINQNFLQNKIIPANLGVFCYEGTGKMNGIDLDGGGGDVSKRYNEESHLECNFGGIGLGNNGEVINMTTIDNMKLDDIGFIHCDAQGSENFIFSKAIETITRCRPVIYYENNECHAKYLYDNVCKAYPEYKEESKFDIKKYCMEKLNYSSYIDKFNGSIDTLLIPYHIQLPIRLEDFEKRIFSQNGEDGITMKLIDMIYENNDNKFYVEFGVADGVECNTRILRERYNWKGLQMDGGNENYNINLRKEFIMKENIVELFKKHNVPQHINLLSVDIDFNDFYCLKEILANYTCDIIICEYNATHLVNEDKVIIYDKHGKWDGSNYFGVSLLALDKLGKKYNYTLVYCNKNGVNCFFVHNDIISLKNIKIQSMGDIRKIYRKAQYSNGPNGGHPQDPHNRKYITFDEAINL